MTDYTKLIELLIDNDVEFVLIGGFAAVVHGSTTLTQDIDICINFTPENCANLLNALKDTNPIYRQNKEPITKDAGELCKFKNLYLLTDFGPLDVMGEISKLGKYEDILKFSIEIDLFERKCNVLDINGLIRSKEEMGRPKDKEVIIQLKAIKEKLEEK